MKLALETRSAFFRTSKTPWEPTFYRAARYDEALEHFREVPGRDRKLGVPPLQDGCDLRAKRNAARGRRRNANSIENQAPKRTRRNRSGQVHFVRVLLGQEDLPVGRSPGEPKASEGPPPTAGSYDCGRLRLTWRTKS